MANPNSNDHTASTTTQAALWPGLTASPKDRREHACQQLWAVQEAMYLLYLLTLSRSTDPIIAREERSNALLLLSSTRPRP